MTEEKKSWSESVGYLPSKEELGKKQTPKKKVKKSKKK